MAAIVPGEPSAAEDVLGRGSRMVKTRHPAVSASERDVAATNTARDLAGRAAGRGEGVGETCWAGSTRRPRRRSTSTIGAASSPYEVGSQQLRDYKQVKERRRDESTTWSDGGVGRRSPRLQGRGVRTEGLEIRAMVPVSVRTQGQRPDASETAGGDARAHCLLHQDRWPGSGRKTAMEVHGVQEAVGAATLHRSKTWSRRRSSPRSPELLDQVFT